jgi:hypothetical protein
MNEILPNKPERERIEAEAKQFEAERIANIVGLMFDAFYEREDGPSAADGALDEIAGLCMSLAKRDPEMGVKLLEALGSHDVASGEPAPTDSIREALGLPVPDYVAMAQEAADQRPSQPAPERQQ